MSALDHASLAQLCMIMASFAIILPCSWLDLLDIFQDHGKPSVASIAVHAPVVSCPYGGKPGEICTLTFVAGLMNHSKNLLRGHFQMLQAHRIFGDTFTEIGSREFQNCASEGFRKYGEAHRNMEKFGIKMLKTLKPIVTDLNTYLNKAIPDTKVTIRRYADVKFEYLSFCLKVGNRGLSKGRK